MKNLLTAVIIGAVLWTGVSLITGQSHIVTQLATQQQHVQHHVSYAAAWNKLILTNEYQNLRVNPDILEITYKGNRILVMLDADAYSHYSGLVRTSYIVGVTDLQNRWRSLTDDSTAEVDTVSTSWFDAAR